MRLVALFFPVLLAAGLAFQSNVGRVLNPADVSPKLRSSLKTKPFVHVLGIAQDAGFPQAGCQKECCRAVWRQPQKRRLVSCLALVDPASGEAWLFDATPDFPEQLHRLENVLPDKPVRLAGIFLTHAHVGHYSGLMHLGREAMNAKATPVYAMPRMRSFLSQNAPWNLLLDLQNIELRTLSPDSAVVLGGKFRITPLLVPHRDEFSETVGYRIESAEESLLFIPDIDKWHLWQRDILAEIRQVDYALLDGTFFQNGEIPGRDMSEIPHPFIVESMETFAPLPPQERAKVHFIHFNHTNRVLLERGGERKQVLKAGFRVAEEGMKFEL